MLVAPLHCRLQGAITASNYAGSVYFRKSVTYDQWVDPGDSLVGSSPTKDDTSDTSLERTSGGNIYELDAPGPTVAPTFATGDTVRFRANFDSYAVLGDNMSTTRISTQDLLFSTRVSCFKNSSISLTLDCTYAGDNQIGLGTTNLSDNLQ
jgi:hypothetical protein